MTTLSPHPKKSLLLHIIGGKHISNLTKIFHPKNKKNSLQLENMVPSSIELIHFPYFLSIVYNVCAFVHPFIRHYYYIWSLPPIKKIYFIFAYQKKSILRNQEFEVKKRSKKYKYQNKISDPNHTKSMWQLVKKSIP